MLENCHNHQPNKWRTLTPLKARYPSWNPVRIGKSVWISTNYDDDGHKGMVQIDCDSNAIKQVVPYPNGFHPECHSVCGSDRNGIIIVDGKNGKLIEFNPKNNKFKAPVSIPQFGAYTSCMMIKHFVHIIDGNKNSTNRYLIYSMKSGKVMEFKDNLKFPKLGWVSFVKMDDGKYIKFGGYNYDNSKNSNLCFVGKTVPNKEDQPIQWMKAPHWTLKKGMYDNGVITKGHYIITFGGRSAASGWIANDLDDIFILDIRSKTGWIQSPIKCPMKSRYVAVMDHQQKAHIFTYYNDNKKHYSISLNDIVPQLAISPMAQSVQSNQQNDDEKGGFEVNESAKLRESNQTLKAMVDSLKDEVERMKRENVVRNEKRKESRKKVVALEVTVHSLFSMENEFVSEIDDIKNTQKTNTDLSGQNDTLQRANLERTEVREALESKCRSIEAECSKLKESENALKMKMESLEKINGQKEEEIKSLNMNQEELQAVNAQLIAKEQQQNAVNKRLKAEIERLRNENAVYEEERKEAQLKITELEQRVKELEMKALNEEEFMKWDWKQIVIWILSLDDGDFKGYEAVLKQRLSEAETTGADLLEVSAYAIKFWGIKDGKHRAVLNGHIQNLVQQYGPRKNVVPMAAAVAPKEDEGAPPTAFVDEAR